jgi:hypothetical protein
MVNSTVLSKAMAIFEVVLARLKSANAGLLTPNDCTQKI